jgi:SepF-like predicted cell division protein (DUF552 family)
MEYEKVEKLDISDIQKILPTLSQEKVDEIEGDLYHMEFEDGIQEVAVEVASGTEENDVIDSAEKIYTGLWSIVRALKELHIRETNVWQIYYNYYPNLDNEERGDKLRNDWDLFKRIILENVM